VRYLPRCLFVVLSFFFTDPATTEIYTLSLHDALPISAVRSSRWCARQPFGNGELGAVFRRGAQGAARRRGIPAGRLPAAAQQRRSEEHTSELQSRSDLVCRLLLEKKKNTNMFVSTIRS